ncbi:hypothetical protein H072_3884 [Dactylellina haptotyla CBS 200.50]|uniref:Uncharacterized protein n=1 Tax=Dactylellina haptotyla (strain CBS 200.50) TaxID=1284197 RepID=S8ALQ7_DACHA|nr:hypothetical protein H072_3884 [Dactylellina haptotyla CBS 200.50]
MAEASYPSNQVNALNEDDITKLTASIKDLFEGQTALFEHLSSRLNAFKTVKDAFALCSLDLDKAKIAYQPDLFENLEYMTAIHQLSSREVDLTIYFWKKKLLTLDEIARSHYFFPADAPPVDEGVANSWRRDLYTLKPTNVFLGFMQTGTLEILGDKKATDLAQGFLEIAIEDGFAITKQSSREIFERVFGIVVQLSTNEHKDVETPSVSQEEAKKKVKDFIFSLQRLQAVVRYPEDIPALLKCGYTSAHSISVDDVDTFVEIITSEGLSDDSARRIHDQALRIEIRNEQTWAIALRERNELVLPYVTNQPKHLDTPPRPQVFGSSQSINLTSLFKDMESPECTNCSSVLSPSAYFVDLLRFLQETPSNRKDKSSKSLFKQLMDRRPDLEYLQLSCSNTNNTIAYIDLVLEALESYVDFLSGRKEAQKFTIAVHNMPVEDTENNDVNLPKNSNFGIYQRVLQSEVYPLAVFPYNQAIDTIRTLLTAAGTSRREVLETFSSQDRLLKQILSTGDRTLSEQALDKVKRHLVTVIKRLAASECLGLSHEDFLAISQEGFQPPELLQEHLGPATVSSLENYKFQLNAKTAAELWGYHPSIKSERSALECMLDENAGDGLSFIKAQLLPRASITIKELQEILKTQYFGRRLVITTGNENNVFTGKLDDMRLRASLLENESCGTLTEELCYNLQAFIRLWKKLGWSIYEIDAIINGFNRSEGSVPFPPMKTGITGEMLEQIAAIKELSEITGLSPSKLQPLWSDIDTNGPNSLYATLFLQPRLTKMDPVFKPDKVTKRILQGVYKTTLGQHKAVILATLQISEKDLTTLYNCINFNADTVLTLGTISSLYRMVALCDVMDIPVLDYPLFCQLFSSEQFFGTARTTLAVLKMWKPVLNAGWSLKELRGNQTEEILTLTLNAIVKLMNGVATVSKAFAVSSNQVRGQPEDVIKFLPLLFESSKVTLISQLIEGTYAISQEVELASPHTKKPVPEALKSKISFRISFDDPKKVRVVVRSLLSEDETKTIAALIDDIKWVGAVETLSTQVRSVFNSLVDSIFKTAKAEAEMLFLKAEGDLVEERRSLFLDHALPILKSQQLQQNVVDNVSIDFPVATSILLHLLGKVVKVKNGQTALQALMSLAPHPAGNKDFDGFLLPAVSGEYIIKAVRVEKPVMTINGIALDFQGKAGSWISRDVQLLGNKTYRLVYIGDLVAEVRYTAPGALTPATFTSDMLITKQTWDTVLEVYQKLKISSRMVQVYGLNLDELDFLSDSSSSQPINFLKFDTKQLLRLDAIYTLRQGTKSATKDGESLIALFKWAANVEKNSDELYAKISKSTSWTEKQVSDILSRKYPGWDTNQLAGLFCDETELVAMNKVIQLIKKVNIPTIEVLSFFRIASPVFIGRTLPAESDDENFKIAAALRLAIQTTNNKSVAFADAYDQLREHQRTALVNYLLNHSKIKDSGLWDADSLFEWFLIDVQMGAKLQTSRIKQAISTVQLYIQRCLFGLEKNFGVLSEAISQVRWKYMSKYTLWEANRKLFLYPENWIDPTLRDNKTSQFGAFEAAILQSNLSMESISAAVKTYIYGVNEIAALTVQTYIWERKDNNKAVFHFFGRTRQTPYQFYYRSLEVLTVGSDVPVTKVGSTKPENSSTNNSESKKLEFKVVKKWMPWIKIEIDIPTVETDLDGINLEQPGVFLIPALSRGRLFLFVPQFFVKQPTKDENKASMMDRAKQEPPPIRKYWEMRLSRSELRNGKWSPKQSSEVYLTIPGKNPGSKDPIPPLSSLRFLTSTYSSANNAHVSADTDDVIIIDVESWYKSEYQETKTIPTNICNGNTTVTRWPLGRFKIQETKITVIDATNLPALPVRNSDAEKTKFKEDDEAQQLERSQLINLPNDQTFPTYFSKVVAESSEVEAPAPTPLIRRGPGFEYLVMAKMSGRSIAKRDYSWTISFNNGSVDKLSGLVLEVATRTGHTNYFAIPPTDPKEKLTENVHLFDHNIASELMERSTTSQGVDSVYEFLSSINDVSKQKIAFGALEMGFNEQATSYSLYNWELGMHIVQLLMERLLATQQFEIAINIARLVFDPTIDGSDLSRCWRFLPFKEALTGSESVVETLKKLGPKKPDVTMAAEVPINEWKDNPFVAHAVARGRPVVYMKRFVMKYIEILIASGDAYFRENSLESIPLAIQRYVEASHLFGPAPQEVPKLGQSAVKTFHDLDSELDAFSNAKVDMELEFPYSSEPCYRGSLIPENERRNIDPKDTRLLGLVKSGYFCVPPNPQVSALRNLIDDRFYKIRNSLDIDGKPLTLALFDPPLDPGMLASAAAAGISPSVLLNDTQAPMPNYRFLYILQKAIEMCSELKGIGEQFLSAKEKKDSEALTMLHARQEVLMNTIMLPIKELQLTETQKSIVTLEEMRKSHVNKLQFYLALVGESSNKIPDEKSEWTDIVQSIPSPTSDDLRMSPYEKIEMQKAESAAFLTDAASFIDLAAGGLLALPNIAGQMQPMGVGVQMKIDAENIAKFMQGTSTFMKLKAELDSHESQRAARKSQMIKQLQDRRLQANQAGHDVKHVDKDIAVQRIRLQVCEAEIQSQKQHIANAKEIQEWHRTKYTNENLYAWLENSFRTIYYNTFLLTMQLARKAERAFSFENPGRSKDQLSYLGQGGYWDSGRDGLLSAQNLLLSLKRLEMAHMEKRSHDYEIVKNVSLRQIDPTALLALRQNGVTTFAIPEILYDFDFPGHYLRRIKSVSVSIPCVTGPYTGLNCTLTLVEHCMRTSSALPYADQGRDDMRFHTDRIPISSIAISNGQNDTGLFECNFHDERYLPFEGAGAISKWRIEFPTVLRQFDYKTISDVVMHIRYTSVDGGALVQKAANDGVEEFIKKIEDVEKVGGGLYAMFDLKNDFSNEWYEMQAGGSKQMRLPRIHDRLHLWARGKRTPKVKSLGLIVGPPSSDWNTRLKLTVTPVPNTGSSATPIDIGLQSSEQVKMSDVDVLISKPPESGKLSLSARDDYLLTLGDGTAIPNTMHLILRYTLE